MRAWVRYCGHLPAEVLSAVPAALQAAGIELQSTTEEPQGPGVLVFAPAVAPPHAAQRLHALLDALRALRPQAEPLVVAWGPQACDPAITWALLAAGAADLIAWHAVPPSADDVACRLQRRLQVQDLMASPRVHDTMVGNSPAWQAAVRSVVEAARYTDMPVLIRGETGTGKEQLARLVHDLGPRAGRGQFVLLDCTTVVPELAGSEFFGHERGAFTGAASARDGAFSLAHRGTLFLDEVGELSPTMQAQLLRVVQERQYKRVGSNSWQESDFRLVCATHRDLETAVAEGRFRADLYHRLAGWHCQVPPLRERRQDVLPLARHFLRECGSGTCELPIDAVVREFLLTRDYPGNVRELRQLVQRLWHRHSGTGPLSAGDVPEQERPAGGAPAWPDSDFETAIRQAVERGIGLNEIGQRAKDTAMRLALECEGDNVQRAAARLQVSDRLLQIRKKERQQGGEAGPHGR